MNTVFGPVAQWREHSFPKRGVGGSIPLGTVFYEQYVLHVIFEGYLLTESVH